MPDKPIPPGGQWPRSVADADQRLGGPPGLYDSPNWDRETTGGIVQRVRVPGIPESQEQVYRAFGVLSVNDTDDQDSMGMLSGAPYSESDQNGVSFGDLEAGVSLRKSIRGADM